MKSQFKRGKIYFHNFRGSGPWSLVLSLWGWDEGQCHGKEDRVEQNGLSHSSWVAGRRKEAGTRCSLNAHSQ